MIVSADGDQAELLAALHAQAFDAPWSAGEIAKLLANPTAFAILACEDAPQSSPQGFILAWAVAADSEILTLAVAPTARRKGIAASLVSAAGAAALLRGAGSMHLEVAEDNEPARALYAKLGFEPVGRRGAYYAGAGGAKDAIVLRRTLPRPEV